MRALAFALLLAAAAPAWAQSRPTSDDMSLLTGRTVGNGDVLVAAALGWPGFWAEVLFAPSSRFNLSLRGGVLYGSPLMGLATGVGGEFSVPMRLHLYGARDIDVAASLRPFALFGEGALVGQRGTFADNFGWAAGADAGLRIGLHVSDAVTLGTGALVCVAYLDTPDADGSGGVAVGFGALAIVEALMSRRTMLFAQLEGGYGLAPGRLFANQAVLSVSLGVAFRLG